MSDTDITILTRGIEGLFSHDDLRAKLALGRPLRVKLGMDPRHRTSTWATAWYFGSCASFKIWATRRC